MNADEHGWTMGGVNRLAETSKARDWPPGECRCDFSVGIRLLTSILSFWQEIRSVGLLAGELGFA